MRHKVLTYGSEALREKCRRVERVDAGIRRLISDMLETMYASNGLGLAAQQIGRTEAICVIDDSPSRGGDGPQMTGSEPAVDMPLVMINPVIEELIGEETADEGCLSFPEIFVPIKRAGKVVVSYMTPAGEARRMPAGGLLGRAVQHEVDHLNGVLLVDRMSHIQKIAIGGKLKRLKKSADS